MALRVTGIPNRNKLAIQAPELDAWFKAVDERMNIYTGSGTPGASSIPQGQWIVYYDTGASALKFFGNYNGTVNSLSGGGSSGYSLQGWFPGTASNVNTGLQTYPGVTKTLTTISAWTSSNVSANATVTIYKNGTSWATVTITTGNSFASSTVSLPITPSDYITASLSASGATNCGFRLDFV